MTLDIGALVGEVVLNATSFDATYVRVVRKMADLGTQAGAAAASTSTLDKSLTQAGLSANAAATGLGRADQALAGAGLSASELAAATTAASAATTEAGLAASKLTQAALRQQAAEARLAELRASDTVTTRQLAAAEASLIAANDRVALSNERVERSTMLGAQTTDRARQVWAAIPGPVKAAAAAVAAVSAVSIDAAKKFQDATTRIQTQANASTAEVNALRRGILAMAGAVATAPDELADAAYHIASVGQKSLTVAQQLAILKISAEGAKLGGANLVDVTNALDAAVVSGIHGVKNYSQAMGVLNSTVGAGDMKMQDLADAFGPLGAVLKGYNVTIQQAGAALATFGDNNLRGADAGTALRMSVQALAVPVAAGKKQLEAWGFSTGNLAKQLQHGGLTEALDALMAAMRANGVTAKQQGDVLTETFGKRAGVGLNVLMGELDRYHTKLAEVTQGGTAFAASWQGYTQTLSFAWDRVKAGAEAAAVSIGNRLLPDATRALTWLGTTGVDDIGSFWHALSTNRDVTTALHDVESGVSAIFDALRNAGEVDEPFARDLAGLGVGVALPTLRLLAVAFKDVAVAVDDVTGFFAHNKPAAQALAIVLATLLVPAALNAGRALAWGSLEATAAGILKVMGASSGLVGRLKSVNLSALAARAGIVLLAVEAYNAIGDLSHLDAAADKVKASLGKPIQGNVFQTLAADSTQAGDALSTNAIKAMSAWGAFSTGLLHPVHALALLTGAGDDAVKKSQGAIGAALGNIHDLSTALYGLSGSPLDAQQKISAVINAMGLSVDDLATKNFPALLGQVQAWIAATSAAQTPTEQAHADILALASGAQTAAQDVQSLKDALDQLAGKALSADEAAITFRNNVAQLDAALKKSHGSLSLNSQSGRDAREAFDQAASSALDLATSLKDSGASTDRVRASLQASISRLKETAGNSDYAKAAIGRLKNALDQLPGSANKAVTAAKNAASGFKTAGEDAAKGYAQGIADGQIKAIVAAAQMGKLSYQAAAKAIESSSPSKAFARVGATVPQGYVLGIKQGLPQVQAVGVALSAALAHGFLAGQPQVLQAFQKGGASALSAITAVAKSAQSKLNSDQQARSSAVQQVASSLEGNFALTNAFGPYGNVLNLSSFFGSGAKQVATDDALLKRLRAKHLAGGLVSELAGMSPQQAIAIETNILSGKSGSIAAIDKNYRALVAGSNAIGSFIANPQFASVIARDKAAVASLQHIEKLMASLVDEYKKNPKALAAALDQLVRGIQVHH